MWSSQEWFHKVFHTVLLSSLRQDVPSTQWCRRIYYKSAPGEQIANKLCSWKKEAGLRTVLSAFMEFTNTFLSGVQGLSWMFITHFIVAMSSGFGKCAHFTCVVDWKCDCRCWAVASSCPRSERGEADTAVKEMHCWWTSFVSTLLHQSPATWHSKTPFLSAVWLILL